MGKWLKESDKQKHHLFPLINHHYESDASRGGMNGKLGEKWDDRERGGSKSRSGRREKLHKTQFNLRKQKARKPSFSLIWSNHLQAHPLFLISTKLSYQFHLSYLLIHRPSLQLSSFIRHTIFASYMMSDSNSLFSFLQIINGWPSKGTTE